MTFDHMSVAKAEATHVRRIKAIETAIETTNADREAVLSSVRKVIDGVPVAAGLALLCNLIRASHRTIKFAVESNPKTEWVDGYTVISEVWAYFPGDIYCPVRLGWGDYSVNIPNGKKYCVYSRHIKNEKYGDNKAQYHMALADSPDRAVKNFKKYLRPYAPSEIALMSLSDFQRKVGSARLTAENEYSEVYREVTQHGSFHNEMRVLVMNNHQFNDPAFGETVKKMLDKLDEQMAKQYEAHHGYYVQVREYLGEQVFDVIVVLDVKKATGRSVGSHRTYKAENLDEVDENLASRLAALSMLESGSFVEGLGHKVSDTSYWVLK